MGRTICFICQYRWYRLSSGHHGGTGYPTEHHGPRPLNSLSHMLLSVVPAIPGPPWTVTVRLFHWSQIFLGRFLSPADHSCSSHESACPRVVLSLCSLALDSCSLSRYDSGRAEPPIYLLAQILQVASYTKLEVCQSRPAPHYLHEHNGFVFEEIRDFKLFPGVNTSLALILI